MEATVAECVRVRWRHESSRWDERCM